MLNKLTKLIPIQYTTLDASIKGRSFGVLIQVDEKYRDDKGFDSDIQKSITNAKKDLYELI